MLGGIGNWFVIFIMMLDEGGGEDIIVVIVICDGNLLDGGLILVGQIVNFGLNVDKIIFLGFIGDNLDVDGVLVFWISFMDEGEDGMGVYNFELFCVFDYDFGGENSQKDDIQF